MKSSANQLEFPILTAWAAPWNRSAVPAEKPKNCDLYG